jgi:hypothetical protein
MRRRIGLHIASASFTSRPLFDISPAPRACPSV